MSGCCKNASSTRIVSDSKVKNSTAEFLDARSSPVAIFDIDEVNATFGPSSARFSFAKIGNVVTVQNEQNSGLTLISGTLSYLIPEPFRGAGINNYYLITVFNPAPVVATLQITATNIIIKPLVAPTFAMTSIVVVLASAISYVV